METDNFKFTLGTYAPQKDLNYRHEQPNYSFYYCSRSNAAIVLRSVEIFLAFHSFYIGHLKLVLSRFRTN